MSNDLSTWGNTTGEDVTTVPASPSGSQDGYVLLLVLLSTFIGGTLVLLFGVLIICRRCCETDHRHSRASDDPEKTNTTYLDDSQPAQEITIKVDDPDGMPGAGFRDAESERFLSSGSATGRRVSFNEAALFEQSKKAQEKGRRYTLTEGDFHHLKNARLSHLPLPPSAALKIVTIHECESSENNVGMTPRHPAAKPGLAIFQARGAALLPQTALTGHGMCPSSALPGDTFNSTVEEASPSVSSDSGEGTSSDGAARSPKGAGAGEPAPPAPSQGAVLHFLTRLRRHASLEGAGPYFRIKKWKMESGQRASSLDTRGSPKRHQFQRQRAASESMDQEDRDAHQTDIIQYIARTDDVVFRPAAGPLLPAPASPTLSLGRIEPSPPAEPPASEQPPAPLYHDIWSLRASLEMYAATAASASASPPAEQGTDRESVRSDDGGDSLSSSGGLPSFPSSLADDVEDDRPWGKPKQDSVESEPGTRKLLQMDSGYASIEAPGGRIGEDQTASEKRFCFTSAGRKATIFESFEGQEVEEEEEGAAGGLPPHSPMVWAPYGQLFPTREALPRRDYSIDEKTDALFNAFVRHDPQFDESPLRAKHRSRTHLRKQWQRTKQYSDPGVRYPPALERHRTPLRRGDSVNYPPDGRFHGTLPRIISAGDEEAVPPAEESADTIQVIEEEPPEEGKTTPGTYGDECLEDGQCPGLGHLGSEVMDKIAGGLEERFYMHLKKPRESPERVAVAVAAAEASPDRSPE